MLTKICTKCGKEKSVDDFYPHLRGKYGKDSRCKLCINEICRAYKEAHKEELLQKAKVYRTLHTEEVRKAQSEWRNQNREHIRLYDKKHAKQKAEAIQQKRKTDPQFRLTSRFSYQIWNALRTSKAGLSWEKLVGYSLKHLIKHLERQFLPGMTWENYGQWHVDHKIPISAFNFTKPEDIDFKRCWALKNLQPLWGSDNCAKKARLEKPFQPSLSFSTRRIPCA